MKRENGFTLLELVVVVGVVAFPVGFGGVWLAKKVFVPSILTGVWQKTSPIVKSGKPEMFIWKTYRQHVGEDDIINVEGRTTSFTLYPAQYNVTLTILSANGKAVNANKAIADTDSDGLVKLLIDVDGDGLCIIEGQDVKTGKRERAYFYARP